LPENEFQKKLLYLSLQRLCLVVDGLIKKFDEVKIRRRLSFNYIVLAETVDSEKSLFFEKCITLIKSAGSAGDLRHLPEIVAEDRVSDPACYPCSTPYEWFTEGKLSF